MKILPQSTLISSLIFIQVINIGMVSASELIDSEISKINTSITEGITLDAAHPISQNGTIYTPWELIHRVPMLAGFQWTGPISQFITPQMYIGTPFAINNQLSEQNLEPKNSYTDIPMSDPTTYAECVQNESYLSFGLGERIENSDILELKAIAKVCAQKFYGPYFNGKTHTTREEYLMMLFTMFGEDVTFDGQFTSDGKYIENGAGFESHFTNVSAKSWYTPYLGRAYELGLIASNETTWAIAQKISDAEAIDILAIYTAYRMNFMGEVLEHGMITTDRAQYNITFPAGNEVIIRVQ
jgi:hypothetical protein